MPPPSAMTAANFRPDNATKVLPSSLGNTGMGNRPTHFGRTSDKDMAASAAPPSSADFMDRADAIMRRIMKCVALDDPNIKKVTYFFLG